jgi:hypothetical protein
VTGKEYELHWKEACNGLRKRGMIVINWEEKKQAHICQNVLFQF